MLRVAAIQLQAHDRSGFAAAWPTIVTRVREAARQGVELIVLPEGTIPGYVLGEKPIDRVSVDSAIDDLRTIARENRSLIVSGAARSDSHITYNSAVVIERDGSIVGYADKTFLWHFDRRWFTPGKRIAPVSTSIGSLGVLICADGRMPMIASELVDAGAEILVMPTAWVTSERDPDNLENIQADLLARIRAHENGVPFIAANKCGIEQQCVAYCGKSQIIASDGTLLALASQRNVETIAAELPLPQDDPASTVAQRRLRRTQRNAGSISRTATSAGDASRAVRIAIAVQDGAYIDNAMHIIEADYAIVPEAQQRIDALRTVIPTAVVDDETIADPIGLIPHRRAGIQLVVWDAATYDPAWIAPLARARATELKLYIVVCDRTARRAFAVDPDGVVLTATTPNYLVASFVLDPMRTRQTLVAPGTDIAEGIERVLGLTNKEHA